MSRSGTHWPWSVLGLSGPADAKAVRSAYARALKSIDQGSEGDKFQALRQAYDYAQAVQSQGFTQRRGQPVRPPVGIPTVPDAQPGVVHPLSEPKSVSPEVEKDIAFQALIATLTEPDDMATAGTRIRQVLEHPLTADPDFAPRIELAIRDLLRRSIADHPPPYLPSYITSETLGAIDERFHWLSDFKTFRARFGGNDDLEIRLLDRAYGYVTAHLGPDLDDARREREKAYIDRVAFFLTYPIVLGLFLLMLLAERRFNIVPDNLVSRQTGKYLTWLGVFVLSIPCYIAGERLLRRADPFIKPKIGAFQTLIGLDGLPRGQRKVLFFGLALSALFAVILVKVRLDYTLFAITPFALVAFLGVVVLNVLILRDVE